MFWETFTDYSLKNRHLPYLKACKPQVEPRNKPNVTFQNRLPLRQFMYF